MEEKFQTEEDVYEFVEDNDSAVVVENNNHCAYIYQNEDDERPQTVVQRASGEVIDTVKLAGPEQDLTEYERYTVDAEEIPEVNVEEIKDD